MSFFGRSSPSERLRNLRTGRGGDDSLKDWEKDMQRESDMFFNKPSEWGFSPKSRQFNNSAGDDDEPDSMFGQRGSPHMFQRMGGHWPQDDRDMSDLASRMSYAPHFATARRPFGHAGGGGPWRERRNSGGSGMSGTSEEDPQDPHADRTSQCSGGSNHSGEVHEIPITLVEESQAAFQNHPQQQQYPQQQYQQQQPENHVEQSPRSAQQIRKMPQFASRTSSGVENSLSDPDVPRAMRSASAPPDTLEGRMPGMTPNRLKSKLSMPQPNQAPPHNSGTPPQMVNHNTSPRPFRANPSFASPPLSQTPPASFSPPQHHGAWTRPHTEQGPSQYEQPQQYHQQQQHPQYDQYQQPYYDNQQQQPNQYQQYQKYPPQQQQQQQQPRGGTIRNIPIFVEGQSEPIVSQSPRPQQQQSRPHTPQSQPKPQPPPKPEPQQPQPQQQEPPKQPEPPIDRKMVAIEKVHKEVEDLRKLVDEVLPDSAGKKSKDFLYLDEMLTRCLISLDNVDPEGRDDVRQARRSVIKNINSAIKTLESNCTAGLESTEDTQSATVESIPEESEGTMEANPQPNGELNDPSKQTNSEVTKEKTPIPETKEEAPKIAAEDTPTIELNKSSSSGEVKKNPEESSPMETDESSTTKAEEKMDTESASNNLKAEDAIECKSLNNSRRSTPDRKISPAPEAKLSQEPVVT